MNVSFCPGMDVPLAGQLRIIHQGRFLEDIKALRGEYAHAMQPLSHVRFQSTPRCVDHKVAEGETTAMHLIIKSEVSKPAGDTRGDMLVTKQCCCRLAVSDVVVPPATSAPHDRIYCQR